MLVVRIDGRYRLFTRVAPAKVCVRLCWLQALIDIVI